MLVTPTDELRGLSSLGRTTHPDFLYAEGKANDALQAGEAADVKRCWLAVAVDSIKAGVECSGTPGTADLRTAARGEGDTVNTVGRYRGLRCSRLRTL